MSIFTKTKQKWRKDVKDMKEEELDGRYSQIFLEERNRTFVILLNLSDIYTEMIQMTSQCSTIF